MATTSIVRPQSDHDIFSQAGEAHRLLVKSGLSGSDYQGVIDDAEWREELLRFWKSRGRSIQPVTETPSQARARQIMGKNFLGIEDVQRHFGVQFSPEELAGLAEVSFPEHALVDCEATHILFPGYPLTILDVHQRTQKKGQKLFYSNRDAWYNNQPFAREEKVGLGWHLIRRDIVHNSTNKTYEEQQKLLRGESVSRACEVVYMTMLYYLVTGNRLFERIYARCQDVSSSGGRVGVGDFGQDGLSVAYVWGDLRVDNVGLAASRN